MTSLEYHTTYVLSAIALVVIAITAAVRVNDIPRALTSWRWHARRLGFVFAGGASLLLLMVPLYSDDHATWEEVIQRWGFALVWLTTPYMPPWWRYISGKGLESRPPDHQHDYVERARFAEPRS